MGWWSDFRDNILKPVAGVVLLGNVLGGGQSNIFKSLFGGGTSAASTGAGLSSAAGGILPSAIPGAAGANMLTGMGLGAAGAAGAGAAASGLGALGGIGKILGGSGGLSTALMLGALSKGNKVPQLQTPTLDAKSQEMQNKLNTLISNRVGDYSNALGATDMQQTQQQYLDYLNKMKQQGATTGFKPVNTNL